MLGIAAAIYCKNVICTGKYGWSVETFTICIKIFRLWLDIDLGGILNVIAENVKRNASLTRNNIQIFELDFKAQKFSEALESVISDVDIVVCADGKENNFVFLTKNLYN